MVISSLTSVQLTGYTKQKVDVKSSVSAEEMAQWGKRLLCSHEVPSLNPQNPWKAKYGKAHISP